MLQPNHWLHIFLVAKIVGHHFWHGLMARAKIEHGKKQKQLP
jgi:hypothetical protein